MKFYLLYLVVFLSLNIYQVLAGLYINEDCIEQGGDHGNNKPTTLYLMQPTDKQHKKRNSNFISYAKRLGFNCGTIKVHTGCDSSAFEITERLIRKDRSRNIINLKVEVPVNVFDENSTNEIFSVGFPVDTDSIKEVFICDLYENVPHTESCRHSTKKMTVLYTQVTSPLKYKVLNEIIDHIDDDDYINSLFNQLKSKGMNMPIQKHSIIICSKNFAYNFESDIIKYHVTNDCKSIENFIVHDVLAVIAPKPLDTDDLAHLPVVFYDTPYLMPEHESTYPYSTTLYKYDNFDDYSERLLNLLQLQDWKRVAMVSDDSPYSDMFEERIIKRFNENSTLYTISQCTGLNCNFTKAMNGLKEVDAKIIIANVDEKYVAKVAQAAADAGLKATNKVLWIFRECPIHAKEECVNNGKTALVKKTYKALNALGESVCFNTEIRNDIVNSCHANIKEREQSQILKAIEYLRDTFFKKTPEEQDEIFNDSQKKRSRVIMSEIKKKVEYRKTWNRKLVVNGTDCESFTLAPHGPLPYTDTAGSSVSSCILRSYKFYSPCEDFYPLAILLVILGVLLLVLIIIVFLKRCHPRLRKYRTFR